MWVSVSDAVCPYPLVPSFSARVVLLGEVPQIVVVVEVEKLHEVLEYSEPYTMKIHELTLHYLI